MGLVLKPGDEIYSNLTWGGHETVSSKETNSSNEQENSPWWPVKWRIYTFNHYSKAAATGGLELFSRPSKVPRRVKSCLLDLNHLLTHGLSDDF